VHEEHGSLDPATGRSQGASGGVHGAMSPRSCHYRLRSRMLRLQEDGATVVAILTRAGFKLQVHPTHLGGTSSLHDLWPAALCRYWSATTWNAAGSGGFAPWPGVHCPVRGAEQSSSSDSFAGRMLGHSRAMWRTPVRARLGSDLMGSMSNSGSAWELATCHGFWVVEGVVGHVALSIVNDGHASPPAHRAGRAVCACGILEILMIYDCWMSMITLTLLIHFG
jgi:hypothetical protein